MEQSVSTWISGMNRDLDKSLLKSSMAENIENFRLVSSGGVSTGALENIKGNVLSTTIPNISDMYFVQLYNGRGKPCTTNIDITLNGHTIIFNYNTEETKNSDLYNAIYDVWGDQNSSYYIPELIISFIDDTIILYSTLISITFSYNLISGISFLSVITIPAQSNLRIIGYTNIRDYTVLFTTSCVDESDEDISLNGYGQLWKLEYNDITSSSNLIPSATLTLLYNNMLKFSDYHPIEAIGRFETNNVEKVYWVDYYNYFRFCNIAQSNLMLLTPSSFDMINDSKLSTPTLGGLSPGGIYKAGVIQYSYQLYNVNGAKTTFSPCSNLIHLTSSDEWASNSNKYKGSDLNEYVSKSIKVNIDDIDGNFTNIKVVAIFWDTLNGVPTIRYVYDNVVPESLYVSFVDDGSTTFGELTIEEFTTTGGSLVIPKTITTKYDYMLLGNIKEPVWDVDFDARAYRFNDSTPNPNSVLYSSNSADISVDPANPDGHWGVPIDHDAISPINDVATYTAVDYGILSPYKYERRTVAQPLLRYGGSGPNVSYHFEIKNTDADNSGDNLRISITNSKDDVTINGKVYPNDSFNSEASPQVDGLIRGYQRDEIYRFGLVFWNNKSKPSFVHWIADIRMPHQANSDSSNDYAICSYTAPVTTMNHLGVVFDINLSSLSTDDRNNISSISIVRMLRDGNNRTVVSNGVIMPTISNAGDGGKWNPVKAVGFTWGSNQMHEFMSPEVCFNKNIDYRSGDFIDTFGEHKTGQTTLTQVNPVTAPNEWVYKAKNILNYTISSLNRHDLRDGKICGVGYGALYSILGNTYRNYIYDPLILGTNKGGAYHGTTMAIDIAACNPARYTTSNMVSANYKRILTSQYGGNTYNNRFDNEYIECARVDTSTTVNTYSIETFGGDTFLGIFDYLRFMWDDDAATYSYQEVCYFPIESSVNLWLRQDTCYSKGGETYTLQESVAQGLAQWPTTSSSPYSSSLTDLYLYNTVYSQENILKTFYSVPRNFNDNELYDVTLMSSQKKINGEEIDSWSIFLPDDRKEVDSKYGQINKLLNWNNNIFFWQDKGFGTQYILPRSLITDNNVSELVLGTGTVLDKHDYISNEIGCKHQWGICSSKNSVAWFDISTKKMYTYSTSSSPISDIKGMKSYFANKFVGEILNSDPSLLVGDNPIHDIQLVGSQSSSGINCVYDDRYNEYVFTFSDHSGIGRTNEYSYITIAFNDLLSAFTAFYSFDPGIYIKTHNKLLTAPKNALNEIWLHDYGDFGSFYGTLYDSRVDFCIKDKYAYSKVFDNLEYTMDVTLNGVDLLKEGMNQIRCYNSYQNTDWYDLVYYDPAVPITQDQINVTRRESNWTLAVPRNSVLFNLPTDPDIFNTANLDNTRPFRERIRDNYMYVNMIYHNAVDPNAAIPVAKNYRVVMPYVLSKYRLSQR